MPTEREPASFRDPAGFIFRREGRLLRQVDVSYAPHYDRLKSSGLYDRLVQEGLLVPHEELPADAGAAPGAHCVLAPREVPLVSYPYEWSFSQLKAAALLTLRVQALALEHGMTLKDASAYNVQFEGYAPVLIDTLSFEEQEEGKPWVAYRQFCEHFLAPLALMSYTDARLGQLLRIHIDGVPLDLAAACLPRRARFRPGLAAHLFLHARSQKRYADRAPPKPRPLPKNALVGLIEHLTSTVNGLRAPHEQTTWGDYYGNTNYSDEAFQRKKDLVAAFLTKSGARTVWDMGANAGIFSRVAREQGCAVVSIDSDLEAVDANYRQAVEEQDRQLLPLVVDLTNPSPALGWAHEERRSLAERSPADTGLALALVHHLAIGNNVPFERIAAQFADLFEHLVIEFVPKEDSQVQRLLRTREDIFDAYTQEGFEKAFQTRFEILERGPIAGSHRVLYLMRRIRSE